MNKKQTNRLFHTNQQYSNSTNVLVKRLEMNTVLNQLKLLSLFLVTITTLFISTTSSANHDASRQYFIRGVAATGINDLCGLPLFNLTGPVDFPQRIHATVLGEYDPGGDLPIPLSPTNCSDDIIIATNTDPNFLAGAGLPDIDIRLKNIPLREVPVISSPDGRRSVIPTLHSVPGNALPPTKSNPNDSITLGDWLNAQGWMYLRCHADGTAMLRMRFRNLIPNGVYSLWGIWNAKRPGSQRARLTPVPLGGIPNVMIPDRHGKATFRRELASCPKDIAADGSNMLFVDLAYHSDSNLAGAFPQIGGTPTEFKTADGTEFSSVLVPGAVSHDHVLFLISGERL